MVKLELVWNFSDAMNALMAVPNLIGLVLLSGVLFRETKAYEMGIRDGSIDKFDWMISKIITWVFPDLPPTTGLSET